MTEPIKLDGGDEKKREEILKIDLSASKKNDDSFEDIFSKAAPKEKESKMMNAVVGQKEALNKTAPVLGSAPILEKTIEQDKTARQRGRLRFLQFIFTTLFVANLGGAFYFYSELSPSFDLWGANTTSRLSDTNTSLRKLQTDSNKYRYLTLQLYLNDFSYQADRFFGNINQLNDQTLPQTERARLLAEVEESQKAMPGLLSDARKKLGKNFVVPTFQSAKENIQTDADIQMLAEADLRSALSDDRRKFAQSSESTEDQNLKLIDNTLKIVGNKTFASALQKISLDDFQKDLADYQKQPDPQKEQNLRDLIGKILGSSRSDLATITDIKQHRIAWSTVIQQIETETMSIDKNYGQPLLYETLGGVVYTGYEFDTSSNKIVLSGSTKTNDGSNFTLISNLLDQLEQSSHFEDVANRSFSKSKSLSNGATEGYTANFKIDLRLEPKVFSSKDKPLSLNKN